VFKKLITSIKGNPGTAAIAAALAVAAAFAQQLLSKLAENAVYSWILDRIQSLFKDQEALVIASALSYFPGIITAVLVFIGVFWIGTRAFKHTSLPIVPAEQRMPGHPPEMLPPKQPAVPENSVADQTSRIFVRDNITPSYLVNIFKDNINIEATAQTNRFVGTWMIVEGAINDIVKIGSDTVYIYLEPTYEGDISRHFLTNLSFHGPWIEKTVILKRGDKISVIGKIDKISSVSIQLENCELKD
jgi:hypothetical protein